jgi:hypothetical protein
MACVLSFMALVAAASGQTEAPSIANVTNAAISAIDLPPNSATLTPRSMATIFGTNLAHFAISAVPPWQKSLAGTEVHLVVDQISSGTLQGGITLKTPCSEDCDLAVDMVYASPTQINFVTPDVPTTNANEWIAKHCRIVLVRDGVRFDNLFNTISGVGLITLDPVWGDGPIVFEAGYECLFSYSLSDPASCGLSWSQGQHRAPLGAITDALSAQVISAQAPVHQGQIITLWMTGLSGLALNSDTGLLQQAKPGSFGFGVAQFGTDIAATVQSGTDGQYGTFLTPTPMWAGESPQFVGLDQVNVAFPTCSNPPASTEKRYDAFLIYISMATLTTVRIYLPFVVRPGDPDCKWLTGTTATLSSSANPSIVGQAVTFNVAVSPSAVTGTVTFLDGTLNLGSGTLVGGVASFTTSGLSAGSHSIVAIYTGDNNYGSSTATGTQTVRASTTITLASSANPMVVGQPITFTATVSPSTATGTVSFIVKSNSLGGSSVNLGSGTLLNGKATCCGYISSLAAVGTYLIQATYSGDAGFGGSSNTMTEVVAKVNTIISVASSPNPSSVGQTVNITATVTPSVATGTFSGTVTFFDGNAVLATAPLNGPVSGTDTKIAGVGTPYLLAGTHSITASYSGDTSANGSLSAVLIQTVNPR